jgi:hypothetical protein
MTDRLRADELLRARVHRNRVIEMLLEMAGPELLMSIEGERHLVNAWFTFEQLSVAYINEVDAGVEDGPIQSQYDQAEAILLGPSGTLSGALIRLLYGMRESIRETLDDTGKIDVGTADYWDLVVWEALADLIKLGGIERLSVDPPSQSRAANIRSY